MHINWRKNEKNEHVFATGFEFGWENVGYLLKLQIQHWFHYIITVKPCQQLLLKHYNSCVDIIDDWSSNIITMLFTTLVGTASF